MVNNFYRKESPLMGLSGMGGGTGRGASGYSGPGSSQANPASDPWSLRNQEDGLYWIQPSGQSVYQVYMDNTRNGGGWVLCAAVHTSTCQDHITTGSQRISGTVGPRRDDTDTHKFTDSWIQALRNGSSYSGSTAYWMEATGFNKSMFISTSATVHLEENVNNDNNRTRVSTTYEGSISDRNPNSGTRGFGDHHTSGGTYFAWGRHPEQGNNCGFREDALGASNGYLWVK
tara:strand:- start:65 stop:754 length:690 start_codon:yes stop_codon:yes gene_type:complete